jgi:Fe-S cluster biosynthesis and repair protein YggX
MTHIVFCTKLKKEALGFEKAPLPGALGERIKNNISQEAWGMWVEHQTMLINEYRLSMIDPKARTYLMQEMENFLFGDGSSKPPGFIQK